MSLVQARLVVLAASCATVSGAGAQEAPYKGWQDAEPAQYAWVLEYVGKPAPQ